MADKTLDVKGLSCPLPVLKARKTLQAMGPGEILVVEATDSSAVSDFEAFCAATKYTLVGQSEADGVFRFQIRNIG